MLIDTLEIHQDLQANGFTPEQAESLTRTFKKASEQGAEHLATKADLEKQIKETKIDLIKWMISLIFISIGITFTLFLKLDSKIEKFDERLDRVEQTQQQIKTQLQQMQETQQQILSFLQERNN